ncbi:Hypp6825 [Branchiostoma lanceolatum]|uniref:Hypp6825 protein n=1 Tax=Branchiostoma lanceolatum TaxID=7740 RepID=A0A8J9YVN4_BRALA|nr:Hypp6825 [Branchiostoma lanceolatum]
MPAASQKKFNRMLEAYRAEILPEVVNGWNDLSEEEQQQFKEMNHLYCNLHALIGFARYSDEAHTKLEEIWRKQYGPLGVEDLAEFQDGSGEYAWKQQDSATQRLIRTACDAVAPGGNQQPDLQLKLNKRIKDGKEPKNATVVLTGSPSILKLMSDGLPLTMDMDLHFHGFRDNTAEAAIWSGHGETRLKYGLQGGDFMQASNILLSGNSFGKYSLLCKYMNLGCVNESTFHKIQVQYCVNTLDKNWKGKIESIIRTLRNKEEPAQTAESIGTNQGVE